MATRRFRGLWVIPFAASGLAVGLTSVAYSTGFELVHNDPCATGWDNGWSVASSASLWLALGAAVVLLIRAVRTQRSGEVAFGAVAIGLIIVLSVVCWVFANAHYGWHC